MKTYGSNFTSIGGLAALAVLILVSAYFRITALAVFLGAVLLLFLARSVMSLFGITEENRFYAFCELVTEFFVGPVRGIFDRFGWGNGSIIDLPYMATMMILAVLSALI